MQIKFKYSFFYISKFFFLVIVWTVFETLGDISILKKCNLTNVHLPISISDPLTAVIHYLIRKKLLLLHLITNDYSIGKVP